MGQIIVYFLLSQMMNRIAKISDSACSAGVCKELKVNP